MNYKKVWYREKFQSCINDTGPYLIGDKLIEATVMGAEANPFGALYMVVDEDGNAETIRQYQVIYFEVNGKKIKNKEVYAEFPFKTKKELFKEFLLGSIIMNVVILSIGLGIGFSEIFGVASWLPAGIVLFIGNGLGLGNFFSNYDDYKEAQKYLPNSVNIT